MLASCLYTEYNKYMDDVTEFLMLSNLSESIEGFSPYEMLIIAQARKIEDVSNFIITMPGEFVDIKDYERYMIKQMDEQCPTMGQEVLVSGEVILPCYDQATNRFRYETNSLKNRKLISSGFKIINMDDIDGVRKSVVGHIFLLDYLHAIDREEQLVDYVPRRYAFATVGSVEILNYIPPELSADIDYSI